MEKRNLSWIRLGSLKGGADTSRREEELKVEEQIAWYDEYKATRLDSPPIRTRTRNYVNFVERGPAKQVGVLIPYNKEEHPTTIYHPKWRV